MKIKIYLRQKAVDQKFGLAVGDILGDVLAALERLGCLAFGILGRGRVQAGQPRMGTQVADRSQKVGMAEGHSANWMDILQQIVEQLGDTVKKFHQEV